MNEVQSVGIVVFNGDDVLLVKSGPASSHFDEESSIPAGKVEKDETNEAASIRELREETGLLTRVENLRFIKTFTATIETKKGPVLYVWHTYLCTQHTGSLASSEETVPYWINIQKLSTVKKLLPNNQEVIQLAKQLQGAQVQQAI